MLTDQSTIEKLKKYFNEHRSTILQNYFSFLKFESISTEEEHKQDILDCASWLEKNLHEMNFTTELWKTTGHPTLFAENLEAGSDKPTLLIYNHYDVQPVDPLDLWDSPPFEPTIKNNAVYARGALDNKGQCMYSLQAVKALLAIKGKLPINIKWIIEGEEETGSSGLSGILEAKKIRLNADYLVICDLGIPNAATPSVTLGTRGIVTMDVDAVGSAIDLHSGTHGGRAFNPLHALVDVLSKLRDSNGKITVPGFYDDVKALTDEERKNLNFSFDEEAYLRTFGIKATGGEKNFPPLERSTIRPTLEINGISGGYSGKGFKTVIPAKANAKVSCRLVPNQDPNTIGRAVADFIESHAPNGVEIKVSIHKGIGKAVRANIDAPVTKAFARSYSEVFGSPCQYAFEGGSIPIIPELKKACGGEVLLMGLGLDEDQIHAPNEHFGLTRFEQGFLVMARAIELLGTQHLL